MLLAAFQWNWALDGWIVLAGVLCAVASALLGSFLVLRRLSMLGDAVSHAVLPGLAVAFFVSQSRSSLPMFLGAVIVGILTALFTEWVRSFGKVDEGASMGVVFTSLFALGLVMIVQAADRVDLDASCVLYGAIELTPLDTVSIGGWLIPRAVVVLGCVTLVNLACVLFLFKELKISAFDPSLASSVGISATWMHYLLMILVAVTAVASFESVGNILVVAMLIVPPATARLLTDRMGWMLILAVLLGASGAVLGHVSAITVPGWFGYRSTNTAGMMAVVVGCFFTVAVFFAPHQGVATRWWRRKRLGRQIIRDDVLAFLYRREEQGQATVSRAELIGHLMVQPAPILWALKRLGQRGLLTAHGPDHYELTGRGRSQAKQLVRSHRLWEQYLHTEAELPLERLHDKAETLEHFTDRRLRDRLDLATQRPELDPHGSIVPEDDDH